MTAPVTFYESINTYWLGYRLVTSISLSAEFTILSVGERRDIVPDGLEIDY